MNVPSDVAKPLLKRIEIKEKSVKSYIRDVVRKNLPNSGQIPFDVKTFERMSNAATLH